MKLQMNRLEHALGISSADSLNNQCKNRHRLLIVARKHNAKQRSGGSLARRRRLYAPVDIDLFRPNAEVFAPNNVSDLVEEFWFVLLGFSR
jgi:hypothetical protein